MRKHNKHTILLLLACVFILGQAAYAQKDVDSLLNEANQLIFENPDKAIEIAQEVYNNSKISINNKINSLLTISTAYSSKRDYEKASDFVVQIKELLPNIENDRQQMNVLNRMASHFQQLQIYDKAIEYLDESLELINAYPEQDSIQTYLGYNTTLRALIYRQQMNCDIAIKYFDKGIEAYKKTLYNPVMNANLSICYYNKGNCLISLKKANEAKASYLKSIDHAKSIEAKSLIAFAQKGLAEVKTLEGNYNEAISLLNNASTISESVGDLVLNRGIYEGLSNNYLALNDWDNYTLFHNKFLALQMETKNSERKTINQSLVYLTETKANEIDQLNKRYNPVLIGLIILIAITLLLLFRFVFFEEKKLKLLQKKLTK